MKVTSGTILATVLSLSVSSGVWGQIVDGKPATISIRSSYYHWHIDDGSGLMQISQLVIPVSGLVPLRENFELRFYMAGSRNGVETIKQDYDLNGTTDARVQLSRSFLNDRLLFSAGANLPTGKRKLNFGVDTVIINLLSENFLNFPIRRFGQGWGFNVLVGGATNIGMARTSYGFMYEHTGSYEPYRNQGDYDPGEIFSFTAGADWQAKNNIFYGDMSASIYTADKLTTETGPPNSVSQEAKVFRQSPQLTVRIGDRYRRGAYRADIALRYVLRGRNRTYDADNTISEQLQLFGNEFFGFVSFRRTFRSGWYLQPSFEVRLVSENELTGPDRLGNSHIIGFGAAWGSKIGEASSISISTKFLTGDGDDNAIDIQGIQISVGLSSTL